MMRRLGDQKSILIAQSNLAITYGAWTFEEASPDESWTYTAGNLKLYGGEQEEPSEQPPTTRRSLLK